MTITFKRVTLTIMASVFLGFMTPELAISQNEISGIPDSGISTHTSDYGRPGYPRVQIFLWGNGQTGRWTVEEGTDLLEFLTVAARGNFDRSPDTRRKNILRVYREGQVGEDPAFEMNINKIFSRQVEPPTLQNGDVLVVSSIEKRRFFSFRNMHQIVGTAASIASLIFLVGR